MSYQLSRYEDTNITVITFQKGISRQTINESVNRIVSNASAIKDAACIIIDIQQPYITNMDEVVDAFQLMERLMLTQLTKTPLYVAVVDRQETSLDTEFDRKKIKIPIFYSLEEALSYGRLKLDTRYLRQSLSSKHTDELKTDTIGIEGKEGIEMADAAPNTTTLPAGCILELTHIESKRKLLVIPKVEITIGRRDRQQGRPDIDLTMWNGAQQGISRQHARFVMSPDRVLALIDLNSSNGTYINGKKLAPHEHYPIRQSDQIEFGTMKLEINFKVPILPSAIEEG